MFSREQFQIFGLPNILFFGQLFILQFFYMFLPLHLQEIGLANWQIGLLAGLIPITAMILSIPFGIFADRIVPKHLVIAGLVLSAIFVFGLGQAKGFFEMVPLFIIGGIGMQLFYISLFSLYYKTIGGGHNSKKIALVEMSRVLGYGLGPFIAGLLLVSIGFLVLLNMAFFAIIPLILLSLFLKKTKGIEFDISQYKRDLGNKKIQMVFLGYFFLALHFGSEEVSHALFLKNVIGLDFAQMGLVFLWIMAVILVFTPLGAGFLDKTKKFKAIIFIGLLASGIGNILYLWTFTFAMVLVSRLVHEFGDALAILGIKAVVPELSNVKRVGSVFGTLMLASYSGQLVGAVISGITADLFGYAMPFVVTGAALFVSVALFGLLFLGKDKK